jgi:nucleoside-diphosphate-sugar epimerase
MKLFILGSSGFIGRRLFEMSSRKTSCDIIGYSSRECNLLFKDSINQALGEATEEDVIIITSAITRLKENSYNSMIQNIQMVENVANHIEKHRVAQVIFFSTVEVYGYLDDGVVITERILPHPNEYYGISKLTGEYLLNRTICQEGIPLTVFRLPGIYGPGGHGKSTINDMVRSAQIDKNMVIYGNGRQKRDYVYVDDIFRIVDQAIHNKICATLNVATGKSYSITDISQMIVSTMGGTCSVEYKDPVQSAGKRAGDMIYDTNLLRRTLPEMVFTDLYEGIELTIRNSSHCE